MSDVQDRTADRELLELAAKAAGIEIMRSRLDDRMHRDMRVKASMRNPQQAAGPWNPLADDGDALRLAVKLKLEVFVDEAIVEVDCGWVSVERFADHRNDPYAATRRAIVRAAAMLAHAATAQSDSAQSDIPDSTGKGNAG